MARKGKIKYRDVVKKVGPNQSKKHQKKQRTRKTYSLYKNDNKSKKRKFAGPLEETRLEKKAREDESPEKTVPEKEVSSSSDEENEPDVNVLLKTFGNVKNNKSIAVESESEDEVNIEEEDEVEDSSEEEEKEDGEHSSQKGLSTNPIRDEEDNRVEENPAVPDDTLNEEEIELEIQKADVIEVKDPFVKHLFYDLPDNMIDILQSTPVKQQMYNETWPALGKLFIQIPQCENVENVPNHGILEKKTYASCGQTPKRISRTEALSELFVKPLLIENAVKVNQTIIGSDHFSSLQAEIFSIINNYQDLYFPYRTFSNSEEIRFTYCLHAANHILKTRLKVIHHNAKLSKRDDVPEEFRDQGLVRPKVLIVVPFKDAAYKVIKLLTSLILSEDKGNVVNKLRFVEDYTGNELVLPKKNPKPEDYELTFQGNTSDDFKMGITVTKKTVKLYSDFYTSDIIVASPLGLRTIIGAEGEPERDFDFLASIELLILDQTDVFLMQNWDHVVHVFNHLHLQPKESHGTDFSRIRTWSLNGWAKYYRQTLIFSSTVLPEINSLFNKRCLNYAGKVKILNPIEFGSISQVVVQIPHVFQKFNASQGAVEAIERRFDFFVNKILPQQKESLMKGTMIYVPSYFDFVRIRNYFKKEDISFVQICEYSKDAKVARARDMFFHGDAHFLLYTERYHFFNRKKIKGIRQLVFYQLPNFPHFYYEMSNLMQEGNQNRKVSRNSNMSVSVIYCKYDVHQLSAVVGSEKASKMVQSDRNVHMMITGGD